MDVPPPVLTSASLSSLLTSVWNIGDMTTRRLSSERDLNVLIGDDYVLKVSNPAEEREVVEMEIAAMEHLARVAPEIPLPRTIRSNKGAASVIVVGEDNRQSLARLISVVDGTPLEGQPITADLAERIGMLCSEVASGLSGFFHPAAGRTLDWDPRRVVEVYSRRPVPEFADLCLRLASLADRVHGLPSGVQHGDVTLTNILAREGEITGLIDFGDMHHTAAVSDLAITLTSVLRNTSPDQVADLWTLARAVVNGYQRVRPLVPDEVEVLGELVIARLMLSLLISDQRANLRGGDIAYITQYDDSTKRVLAELSTSAPDELAQRFHRIAGTARSPRRPTRGIPSASAANLKKRRERALGGTISPLFYQSPLHIVRGEGNWLYSADGTSYLDAYNNVAVVGHCHPAVVRAVSEQMRVLNTNSRYLHAGIVELAERLVATLPPELDSCLFTASGTEANELAWRLATEYTGGDGAIILRHAYHGSSKWMADLSSNEWPTGHAPSAIATIEAPRGPVEELTEEAVAARVVAAAAELQTRGHRAALVLVDPGFTSEGVLDAPASYLRGLVSGAHSVGALFLADEVQSGYGRSGPQFWRHTLADITPDIVTMGKPMGAGHPMGGTIARRELLDRLGAHYEYFSTFAATPVSAAAGNAVLDVLEDGGLMTSAPVTGTLLREGLSALACEHAALGQVRGIGLVAGVDLFPDDLGSARARSQDLLERLAGAQVLAGLTGPNGTVLKVRPPLTWTSRHVELFLNALKTVL